METLDEFQEAIQDAIGQGEGELPGESVANSRNLSIFEPIGHGAFERLMELIRADKENLKYFLEDWEDSAARRADLTVAELAEELVGGYFRGFQGTTLKELYDFQYSSAPLAIEAQGWSLDEALVSEDGFMGYLFSHASYQEYDSWALVEDSKTGEVRYFGFSWV